MNLTKLLSLSRHAQTEIVSGIDASAIKNRALKNRFEKIRGKQGGFTLLELLVVVAILAAIAGTATIMLQDTDRKGAAAAHVAMMDELSKGIQTFRVLNRGLYPNNFDSLLRTATASIADTTGATDSGMLSTDLAANMTVGLLTAGDITALSEVGITTTRVIDNSALPADWAAGDCLTGASIKAAMESKKGNVTPQNVFRPAAANGCGAATNSALVAGGNAYLWNTAGNERVNAGATDRLIAFGVGPDSNLFNPSIIGALSNSPVYRHVAPTEYNRFIVLWNTGPAATPVGQATFQAIVDGAGDTKDEELGEVDNIRKT